MAEGLSGRKMNVCPELCYVGVLCDITRNEDNTCMKLCVCVYVCVCVHTYTHTCMLYLYGHYYVALHENNLCLIACCFDKFNIGLPLIGDSSPKNV